MDQETEDKFDYCLELFIAHCEQTGAKGFNFMEIFEISWELLKTDDRYSIYFEGRSFLIGYKEDNYYHIRHLVWEKGNLPNMKKYAEMLKEKYETKVITCKSRVALSYFHDNLLRLGFEMKDDINVKFEEPYNREVHGLYIYEI